jgi:hypothetical protein
VRVTQGRRESGERLSKLLDEGRGGAEEGDKDEEEDGA